MNKSLSKLVATLLFTTAAMIATESMPLCAAEKPNVLFVFADQWRADAFGYSGNPDIKTPHLDRLERENIRFVNAVSGISVCSPTRASLMTGQRPLTHGVFMNDVPLNPDSVTIAKVLAQAGYDTGYIGKWHIDGHGRSSFIPRERRQGFEYWKVLECTHDYNNSFYFGDMPQKLKWEGYDAIAQTRDAQQYIRTHANGKGGKPFLLFLSWGPPHSPYHTAPANYRAMYRPEALTLRPNIPEEYRKQARLDIAAYYAHCSALDDCIGDLCQTLIETGSDENTLIVFTADHGDLLASHGCYNKQQPFEESVCVPLLLRLPKAEGVDARRLEAPIDTEDIMPTILGLCGVPIPKQVEGRDYSGYVRGGADPSDGAALISCPAPFGQWARKLGGREYRGIRTPRHTYVRDMNGPWLLFDNRQDPYQLNNLAGSTDHAGLQADLETILKRKLEQTHDEFLPAASYIKKWGYNVDSSGTVPYKD